MDRTDRNILLGLGGLGALLLLGKKKASTLSPKYGDWDASRFSSFDYYDKQTQEDLKEQAQKDKQTYYGDNSSQAFYESFYDYSNSPDQQDILEVAKGGESFADLGEASAFRARIVPNSFMFRTTASYQAPCYLYFIVEIFNPFAYSTDKTRIARIKNLEIKNIKVNGEAFTGYIGHRGLPVDLDSEAINEFLEKYNKAKDYTNCIFGGRSLFIPMLSIIPNIGLINSSGGLWRNEFGCPSVFREVVFGDSDNMTIGHELVSSNYDWIKSFSAELHLQLQSSTTSVTEMIIKTGDTNTTTYSYSPSSNQSISTQKSKYFNWEYIYPIYTRKEVCEHLYPYKTGDLATYVNASNGLWESASLLLYASKFNEFGNLDPLNVLFK